MHRTLTWLLSHYRLSPDAVTVMQWHENNGAEVFRIKPIAHAYTEQHQVFAKVFSEEDPEVGRDHTRAGPARTPATGCWAAGTPQQLPRPAERYCLWWVGCCRAQP